MTRTSGKSESDSEILSWVSDSMSHGKQAASDAAGVTMKLLRSTGIAAWSLGTTFLILVLPLIIEMDREQQLNDLDLQQATIFGTPPLPPANK